MWGTNVWSKRGKKDPHHHGDSCDGSHGRESVSPPKVRAVVTVTTNNNVCPEYNVQCPFVHDKFSLYHCVKDTYVCTRLGVSHRRKCSGYSPHE